MLRRYLSHFSLGFPVFMDPDGEGAGGTGGTGTTTTKPPKRQTLAELTSADTALQEEIDAIIEERGAD